MPLVLNAIYLVLLLVCAPWLAYRAVRSGRYRGGWSEKVLGEAPLRIGDRPALLAGSCHPKDRVRFTSP